MPDAPSGRARTAPRYRRGAGRRRRARTRRLRGSSAVPASRSPRARGGLRRSDVPPARSPAGPRSGRDLARWLGLLGRCFLGGLLGLRCRSLRLRAAALAPPPPPPPRASAALLRCREVLRERERDLLDRAEALAR